VAIDARHEVRQAGLGVSTARPHNALAHPAERLLEDLRIEVGVDEHRARVRRAESQACAEAALTLSVSDVDKRRLGAGAQR
jgi:hypothetical protein